METYGYNNPESSQNQNFNRNQGNYRSEKKLAAGILAILLGGLGIHKFYLGYIKEGIIQIVITFATCGILHFLGMVEGVIYLTMPDEQFDRTYVQNKKGWF